SVLSNLQKDEESVAALHEVDENLRAATSAARIPLDQGLEASADSFAIALLCEGGDDEQEDE
ncbi:unnamed protein product, partial [Amoebophrya sp. A25]